MLANGGKRITPTLIDRIQDRNGKTIFRADQRACDGCGDDRMEEPAGAGDPRQRASRSPIRARPSRSSTMLKGVVQRGTGTAVKAVGKPIAGKTGTTNDWQDAWFVGFTPDLAAGVYRRLRRSGQSRLGRDRRPPGGADLPRFHDRRAEGRAGHGVPHAARACGCTGSARRPGCRPGPASRRSGRATSPAPSPATTAMPGLQPCPTIGSTGAADAVAVAPVAASPDASGTRASRASRPGIDAPAGGTGGLIECPLVPEGRHHFSAALTVAKWNATLPDRIRH